MKKTTFALLTGLTCLLGPRLYAQDAQWANISLTNLDAFNNPGKNWSLAADATTGFMQASVITPVAGTGAIINTVGGTGNTHLVTNVQMGDVDLELEFMMAKGANSGVYLLGRYEVQLFDSWMKLNPTYADCGGIYQRWNDAAPENMKGYQGIAPLSNAAKAPGLWQKLHVKFHAPKFDDKGVKTANAYFEAVYLNGVLVQQQVAVTGPTRSAMFDDEKAQGPLMLQGDHGNVAFRNIHYRALSAPAKKEDAGDNPIVISTEGKPYILRSYLNYGDKKLTHIISAGYPNQVNYSYNLKQGSLLQVWRGHFLDVTDMWHERGEPQLAKPLGAVTILSGAPALAVLTSNDAAWPDSVAFDDFHNMGYVLDANRFATYEYEVNGTHVFDNIATPQATGLTRTFTVTGAPANLYCRVAAAGKIQKLDNGLYAVDDKAYYVQLSADAKATVRQTASGWELLLPVGTGASSVSYSLIW